MTIQATILRLVFYINTLSYIILCQGQLAVHEICSQSATFGAPPAATGCPRDATCRPTSCDGFTCLCNDGFVASEDRSTCLTAVRIGEPCESNKTRCLSDYAKCMAGTCSCIQGFTPTKDGRCKMPGTNFVGETCGMCEFPSRCVNSMCKCAGEYRSLTTEEFWVDPLSTLQCRPRDYDLEKCNGTFIDASLKPVSDQTVSPTHSSPGVITNDWSLIMPEKSVHDSCSSHGQCPENARCRPNSCDGFLCLCNIGYIASDDRLQCVPAVKTGDVCNPRIDRCLSPFASCSVGICKCTQFSSATIDGRCRVSRRHFIGEICRSDDECEYPGTCQNGQCACVLPNRRLTNEEFWIDPTLDIQCRPKEYSVWKCNGSVIAVPAQFQNEIPIDIEIELTYTKEHKISEDDKPLELNPAIIVNEGKEDDEGFVPIHIIGFLAAAVFALLIAFVFKTKRRRAIKRDVSVTRTNIMANKDLLTEEEAAIHHNTITSKQIAMATQMHHQQQQQHSPIAHMQHGNFSIYNKNGWHHAELLNESGTDIYPDSQTTTRSTGPFIIDTSAHSSNGGGGLHHGDIPKGIVAPFDSLNRSRNQFLVDGSRNGPYIVDGQRNGHVAGTLPEGYRTTGSALYANESWHPECHSQDDVDLVMF